MFYKSNEVNSFLHGLYSLKFTDMGFSKWQVESFADRSHKQRSWPRIFTKASLSIFLWGGSTSQVLGSGI